MSKRLFLSSRFFAEDDRGVTAIEYALLASLIAMVIVVGVTSTGTAVNSLFSYVANCVSNAVNGGAC